MGLGTNIVNLANINLDVHEKAILAKGLKFIPAPKQGDQKAIVNGFQEFSRKIKLSYFFHNKPKCGDDHKRLFREKSSWEPNDKLIPPEILEELDMLKVRLGKIRVISEAPNLSSEEYEALARLKHQHDVVFKKADKGNAIVIMDKSEYLAEAQRQLENERYYKKIDTPIFPDTCNEVTEILNTLQNNHRLNLAQVKYLSPPEDPRPRIFYLLPKIHKAMEKWSVENKMPPGRPIVSDCGSDSYKWSELIDFYLKPLSNIHPSYIKDTDDFLDKIRDLEISKDALLVTFDVESLYTNIQPEKGLEALEKIYRRSGISMPFDEIKRLLELSLNHNDFQFDNQWYVQVSGTAMGKRYAPNYANIFMANFEYEVMEKATQKPRVNFRFLDDGFLVWEQSRQDLDEFLKLLNSHDDSIKITAEVSESMVDFLDVTVFKGNRFQNHGILDTRVHFKATDTHELLDRHSFHPKHTFSGIIKSQLLRFMRICNNLEDFEDACSKLFKALKERRHYSSRFLRKIKTDFVMRYRPIGLYSDPLGAALKCGRKRCECCLRIKEDSYFGNDETEYPIFGRLDCQSKNIIYLIECQKCHIQYVGETQRTLASRLNNHISDINRFLDKAIPNHFHDECWPHEDNFSIQPIEFIPDQGSVLKNKKTRLLREAHWIRELGTQQPYGLNSKLYVKRNVTVSLPYSQTSQNAHKLFRETFQSIKNKFPIQFRDELVTAFSRNKNLGDYLVSSKLK